MDYECQLAPFNTMTTSPVGIQEPLCSDCQTPDCSNPIEEQSVAVLGIPKKMRLWIVNNVVKQVVACKGYVGISEIHRD